MTTLSALGFEDQTPGGSLTLPSGWTNEGNGAAWTIGAYASHGSIGLRSTQPSGYRRLRYTGADATTPLVLSWYLRVNTLSTAAMYIASAYRAGTTGAGDVRINANRTLTLRNSTTAVATSTATLTVGQWYRLEWRTVAASDQELRVYDPAGTTPLFTLAGTFGSATQSGYAVGLSVAAANYSADIDSVQVADTWTGPWVDAPPPVAKPTIALPNPAIIAHRAGVGQVDGEAEETARATFRAAATSTALIEVDLQVLSGATTPAGLACCHDATIDRTAHPSSPYTTGNVESFTTAQWASIRMVGAAGEATPAATWADLVALHKPTGVLPRILCPEIKTSTPYVAALDLLDASACRDFTIVQSFSMDAVTEAARRGYVACKVGTSPDFAALKAARVEYAAVPLASVTDNTLADAATAQGIGLWVYTVNTTADRATYAARGASGFFTDRPDLLAPRPYLTERRDGRLRPLAPVERVGGALTPVSVA